MRVAQEINGYLNNMNEYAKKIEQAVEKQLSEDFETDEKLSDPNCKRFIALNIILANCAWVKSNLKGIHVNMLTAIEQEKVKL